MSNQDFLYVPSYISHDFHTSTSPSLHIEVGGIEQDMFEKRSWLCTSFAQFWCQRSSMPVRVACCRIQVAMPLTLPQTLINTAKAPRCPEPGYHIWSGLSEFQNLLFVTSISRQKNLIVSPPRTTKRTSHSIFEGLLACPTPNTLLTNPRFTARNLL